MERYFSKFGNWVIILDYIPLALSLSLVGKSKTSRVHLYQALIFLLGEARYSKIYMSIHFH